MPRGVRVRVSPSPPNSNAGLRREVIRLLYTESDDSSSLSPGTSYNRSVAQSGRVLALGARSPRFESLYSDHSFIDRNAHRCAAGLLIRVSLVRSQIGQPFYYGRA